MLSLLAVLVALAAGHGFCPLFGGVLPTTRVKAAPYCNVTLLGTHLCACFGNNNCVASCGCLVPKGTCTRTACALPRLCMCQTVAPKTADCSPVNDGPCIECFANKTLLGRVHTPRALLHHEFSLAPEHELRARAAAVRLHAEHAAVPQLIEALVDRVVADELARKE